LLKALKTLLHLKVERLLQQKDKTLEQPNVLEQVTPEMEK